MDPDELPSFMPEPGGWSVDEAEQVLRSVAGAVHGRRRRADGHHAGSWRHPAVGEARRRARSLSRLLALFSSRSRFRLRLRPVPPSPRLTEQVGQLIVMSFQGTAVPQYVLDALRERRAAGVILFGGNVESPRQLRTLTAALRSGGGSPLVAVDQEGGDVRIVPWAPPESSAPEQAAAGTVGRDARRAGLALRRAGVNVSLAPVADVPSVPGSALAGRSFSSDPKRASSGCRCGRGRLARGGCRRHRQALPGARRPPR